MTDLPACCAAVRQWLAVLLYGWACWLAHSPLRDPFEPLPAECPPGGQSVDPELADLLDRAVAEALAWRERYEELAAMPRPDRMPRQVVI